MEIFNYDGIFNAKAFRVFLAKQEFKLEPETENIRNQLKAQIISELESFYSNKSVLENYPFLRALSERDKKYLDLILFYSIFLATEEYDGIEAKLSSVGANIDIRNAFQEIADGGFCMEESAVKYSGASVEHIYDYHIRYYDELFAEIDKMKSCNPTLKEVYFGRDAIFMYKARRSLLLGQGAKSCGSVIYLPFSRDMKKEFDSLNSSDISIYPEHVLENTATLLFHYLRDHRISISNISDLENYVFLDTGLKGSIPSFLIRTIARRRLGIDNEHEIRNLIKDRAFLLFSLAESVINSVFNKAHKHHRKQSATDLANIIEGAPKPVSPYHRVAVYKDGLSGKYRAKTRISELKTITKYNLFRFVIMRHYFMQGICKNPNANNRFNLYR